MKRMATEIPQDISFTIIAERRMGWVYVIAILNDAEKIKSKIPSLLARLEKFNDRFECMENVSRAQLNSWLCTEYFATMMDINQGEYRGHQIGYFDRIDNGVEIDRQRIFLHTLDERIPTCGSN